MTHPFGKHAAVTQARVQRAKACECHREGGSHELCCGHQDGRNPDCPIHGDGSHS